MTGEPAAEVTISWETAERPLEDGAVIAAVEAALAHGGRPGIPLGIVFVSDAVLTEMHARHLDDPTPTDVLSFDLGEEGGGPAGELYVSVDRARDVAGRRGVEVARELALYVVHGTLHLCGFDDHVDGDRDRMRAAEAHVLATLGYTPDPGPHDEDLSATP